VDGSRDNIQRAEQAADMTWTTDYKPITKSQLTTVSADGLA